MQLCNNIKYNYIIKITNNYYNVNINNKHLIEIFYEDIFATDNRPLNYLNSLRLCHNNI